MVCVVTNGRSEWQISFHRDGASRVMAFAARELRKYIERMTSVTLPIGSGRPSEPVIELIEDDSLPEDGFDISIGEGRIRIAGHGVGVLYGVYDLLERAGCRFIVPGDDHVPRTATLSFDEAQWEDSPDVAWRMERLIDPPHGVDPAADLLAQVDWCAKNRLNWLECNRGWLEARRGALPLGVPERLIRDDVLPAVLDRGIKMLIGCHTFFLWCPPEEYLESHPEYYSEIAGKRQPTQLCVTNPNVERIVAERMIAFFDNHPEVGAVALGPEDGVAWCECDSCKAADAPMKKAGGPFYQFDDRSRSYFEFADRVAQRVAKKYPDRYVAPLAYVHYTMPPVDFVPASNNLAVQLAWYWVCGTHALNDAECSVNSYFREAQDRWVAQLSGKGPLIALDYHYGMSAWNLLPWPALRLCARNWEYSIPQGVGGYAFQYYKADAIGYRLTDYIWAKFMWESSNTRRWPDLLRETCTAYFGREAGGTIAEYYMNLEQAAEEYDGHLQPSIGECLTRLIPRELLERLCSQVEQARRCPLTPLHSRRTAGFIWQHELLVSMWRTLNALACATAAEQRQDAEQARAHYEETIRCGIDTIKRFTDNPMLLRNAARAVASAEKALGLEVHEWKSGTDDQTAADLLAKLQRKKETQ